MFCCSGTTLSSLSQPSPVFFNERTHYPSGGSRHSTPGYPASPPYSSPSGSTTFTDYDEIPRYSPCCSSPSPSQLTGSSTPSDLSYHMGYPSMSSPYSRDNLPNMGSKHRKPYSVSSPSMEGNLIILFLNNMWLLQKLVPALILGLQLHIKLKFILPYSRNNIQ